MRLFLALCSIFFVTAAQAQQPPPCGPSDQIIAMLTGAKYGERHFLELGNDDGTRVMHIYANTATGTWSLVGYPQPGIACVYATGKSIEPMGSKPPEPPVNPI